MTTFEEAYQRHYRAVVRSAWSICRDLARAEELAQEAFVRAYRRWSKLERGGYAVPWLHRAAMNLALTSVKRRTQGRGLEALGGFDARATVGPAELDEVVALLKRLPRRQREAVFLRVVIDLPEEAVAALMGCTVGTVKVHKKRGLDRLRELIEPTGATVVALPTPAAPVTEPIRRTAR